MKRLSQLIIAIASVSVVWADDVKRNVPYAEPANERQMLDVYAPEHAKNLPVVFWIHGGGWQVGDKTDVQYKPKAFVNKGYVFVSTNYRFMPKVDMGTIVRDIAKSIHWVHDHIADHGGDPKRILVMGHSAGAQLAALICTDERYLKAEGVPPTIIKGCVPVDGDTYDVPLIIETAAAPARPWASPIQNSAISRSSAATRQSTATSPRSTTSPVAKTFRRFCSSTSLTIPTPAPRRSVWPPCSPSPASPRSSSGPRIQNTPSSTTTSGWPTILRRKRCLSLPTKWQKSEIADANMGIDFSSSHGCRAKPL